MNLCTFSNITVFVPSEKNHYHVKGVTMRASDTVKLYLKVQIIPAVKKIMLGILYAATPT